MKKFVWLALMIFALSVLSSADVISFGSDYKQIGSFKTDGLLDWADSWTWNGVVQRPPDDALQLSSTINFFTEHNNSHDLFIQVLGVNSGNGAGFFGEAFSAITITGLRIQSSRLPDLTPSYSGQFANSGQYREGTTGGCSESQSIALDSTPGWTLDNSGGVFNIHTVSGATNGFTNAFGCIYGDFRIINGGVFALDFGENLKDVHANDLTVAAVYGNQRQAIYGIAQDTEPNPVPEPSSLILLGSGLAGFARVIRRK